MRFFSEELDGKNTKETIIIIANDDAKIMIEAMEEHVKNNKKKVKAKKLLAQMNRDWGCFTF